jgi:phosphatidylcholine synthase
VLLYLFALGLPPYMALAIVAIFVLTTFVPILAVHPFRVARLRPLTCLVTLLWVIAASTGVANPFPSPDWVQALLVATALYLTGLGLYRSLT